jgi:hypothetical protein
MPINSNTRWLASRAILAVKADGQRMNITLRIGFPYEVTPDEWACPIAMEGFQDRFPDIHGIDAWQAVQLVQNLQAQLLGYFVQDGGKLFCHEPPEPIELDDLFPKVPAFESKSGPSA